MPDSVCFSQTPCIRLLTDGEHVEDGADDGHEEDRAKLVEEEPVGHEVARLADDGRQQEEEEDVGGEGDGDLVRRRHEEEEQSDAETEDNEDTRLGQELVDPCGFVETWPNIGYSHSSRMYLQDFLPILMKATTRIHSPTA